jgi:hypothetical protein
MTEPVVLINAFEVPADKAGPRFRGYQEFGVTAGG